MDLKNDLSCISEEGEGFLITKSSQDYAVFSPDRKSGKNISRTVFSTPRQADSLNTHMQAPFFGGPIITLAPGGTQNPHDESMIIPYEEEDYLEISPSAMNLLESRLFHKLRLDFSSQFNHFMKVDCSNMIDSRLDYLLNKSINENSHVKSNNISNPNVIFD